MSVVVTGASGQYGRLAARRLLARIPAAELILTTRTPGDLAEFAQRGVDVRRADFDEPETLRTAFAGAERLLLISTTSVGRRVRQHSHAVDAAKAAGVRHVVYTSFVGTDSSSAALVLVDHRGTEDALRRSGLAWTFLRDSQYADAIADVIAPTALATGRWRAAAGDGLIAPVAREDCVDCAVAVLTGSGHENTAYDITGPQLLSYRQAAELVAEVAGRPVDYEVISDGELYEVFDALGVPRCADEASGAQIPWSSDDMVSFERAIRDGELAVRSEHVRELLGRPPRSLRDLLAGRDYSAGARRSTSSEHGPAGGAEGCSP
ncbi:SDR family oxidoreductase [Frankia sp. QA3]|uniref:SDR family oxidoreductase n=1 Tax=Frankia sp. QA3 TaxID=710111 RepID=UPI000269BF76|nr:SDR family oxidoreductase [Frankia sp. QA3]EIV92855.1 putative nucleoside-diphosphate sugar epimerase [Frankia sp. QA3]